MQVRGETLPLDLISKGMIKGFKWCRDETIGCALRTTVAVFVHPDVHQKKPVSVA